MKASPSKCKPPTHFFKFIRPGFNCQLSLPKAFTKHLENGRRNKKTAILRRGCQKWRVKVLEGWVLAEGFEIFVKENGVQEWDFIIFKHEGNMVFDTIVHDDTGCEREYPTDQEEKPCPKAKFTYKSKGDSTPALKKIQRGKDTYTKRISRSSKFDKSMESNFEKTTITHNSHSYFIDTLTSTNWKYKLFLPFKFVVANGLTAGEMILKNVENKDSWKVKYNNSSDKCFYISWNKFRIANGLHFGDCFHFELIENGEKPVAIISRLLKETPKGKAAT